MEPVYQFESRLRDSNRLSKFPTSGIASSISISHPVDSGIDKAVSEFRFPSVIPSTWDWIERLDLDFIPSIQMRSSIGTDFDFM
ncbi:hypothetical protein L1887_15436 [Cichorium endivia]|nr:hypothetical protein L1887_15436 [Cichorium endivia]